MKIIVGLGNPGKQYQGTRHNVGFDLLKELATRYSAPRPTSKFEAEIADLQIKGERALLVAPQTYMNLSGNSVQKVLAFYKVPLTDLIVAADDFSIPLERIRLRNSGSSGGQRGLQSIIQQLGTQEFPRLRLGIGPVPAGRQAADFVLAKFTREEEDSVRKMINSAANAVEEWITAGIQSAMNKFNLDPRDSKPPESSG
ncbi:MAG: aminoacyl-tRNA hydrolase [Planctomycetales bacterium]